MAAVGRAAQDAGALVRLVHNNQPALRDPVQNDPVKYGDLTDAIGAAKRTMAESR